MLFCLPSSDKASVTFRTELRKSVCTKAYASVVTLGHVFRQAQSSHHQSSLLLDSPELATASILEIIHTIISVKIKDVSKYQLRLLCTSMVSPLIRETVKRNPPI